MTSVSFLYAFWLLMVHLFVGNFLPALKNKPKTEVQYQYQQNNLWNKHIGGAVGRKSTYQLCHKLFAQALS